MDKTRPVELNEDNEKEEEVEGDADIVDDMRNDGDNTDEIWLDWFSETKLREKR